MVYGEEYERSRKGEKELEKSGVVSNFQLTLQNLRWAGYKEKFSASDCSRSRAGINSQKVQTGIWTECRESIQQWRKQSWRFCGLTQKNQTSLPLPLNASTRVDWEGMSDGLRAKYRGGQEEGIDGSTVPGRKN